MELTTEPSVSLISSSQGPNNMSIMDTIVFCARVSNPKSQEEAKNNSRLINYLIRYNHWSPFEMANICLEITTTRDISRQILRHRAFSYQEFSQRYAEALDTVTDREPRLQDTKNRQNSLMTEDEEIRNQFFESQREVINVALENYHKVLASGIAKEQARALLPEGLTKTRMYMNGNIRSWIHYVQVRTGPETQKEHREIALQ